MSFLAATQACIACAQSERSDAIRAHIEARLRSSHLHARHEKPLLIEWTLTKTSLLPSDDIDARWKRIEPFPDHPDRSLLEFHRSLAAAPDVIHGRLLVLDNDTWMMEERHASGYEFKCGGLDGERWMISGGIAPSQLTLIKSGVPFPAMYNVGQFFGVASRHRGAMLDAWLADLPRELDVESIEPSESEWRALIVAPGGSIRVAIRGDWCEDRPRLRSLRRTDRVNDDKEVVTSLDAEYSEDRGCAPPVRVTLDTSGGVRESYDIKGFALVTERDAESLCRPPAAVDGVRVVDFRREESAAWAAYPNAPRVTWTNEVSKDAYAVEHRPGHASSRGSGGTRLSRGFGIGLLVVVVATGIFVALRRR